LAFGIVGASLQIVGNATGGAVGAIMSVVGLAGLIYGYSLYARMKGRNPAWGIMGFFNLPGLLVLYFLGKKCHHCGEEVSGRFCCECGAPASK